MKKSLFFLSLTLSGFINSVSAQTVIPCKTDEMVKHYKEQNPQIAVYEKQLEEETRRYISHNDISRFAARTTAARTSDTDYYDIPLVVHVMHNYGPELLNDNKIYALVSEMNRFYSLQYNYSSVITPFKPYIGKANFRFHLATKDPYGNPTKGITHRFTYLTSGGDDQAKMDQWPPSSYVNIWFESYIGDNAPGIIVVAYATPPASAAAYPFNDGIIGNYSFINDTSVGHAGGSIDHEMGHIFNLAHTFGSIGNPHEVNKSGDCTSDDGVDDTPPTQGNLGGCSLYDTVCATNYFRIYTNINGGDSLVNYPDTSNEQNIMNYAACKVMFTKGQVARMRAALNSNVGGRNNLWDSTNLMITGALDPMPDLPPVCDFSPKISANSQFSWFTCPGTAMKFYNNCWGDTVTDITWTFSNSATTPTVTNSGTSVSTPVTNSFADQGWLNLTIAATGNNSGTTTTTFPRSVYVADVTATPAASVFQEFTQADTAKWPMFNYYNNEFKWQYANVGMYDHSSIEYVGYDSRLNTFVGIFPTNGMPLGDFDDFFSIPVDLRAFSGGTCYLNYNYSGASRSGRALDINDTMAIDYSKDHGNTWVNLAKLTKGTLDNKGASATPYTPTWVGDWAPMGISIPEAAKTDYTVFRFRYKPGVIAGSDGSALSGTVSSGNNFYMDRINFSPWPAEIANVQMGTVDVAVVPNPTGGDAYVVVKDANNATVQVVVSDITGKVVYTTTRQMTSNEAHIEIPRSAISVKGMYIVQAATGTQVATRKLVVD